MVSPAESNTNWKSLYRVGGAAALIRAVQLWPLFYGLDGYRDLWSFSEACPGDRERRSTPLCGVIAWCS
jgi:hypothetical protein